MEFARTTKKRRAVNLTPLIDIIFLLVVFFLLTSEFVLTEAVDLNITSVKSASSVENAGNSDPVLVILKEGNSFVYSGKEYSLSLIGDIVGDELKDNKDRSIIVTNRQGVSVQELVTAMDGIKSAGGYNISIVEGSG
ncbi:MAG: hypothetical protein COV35_02680 [Alphaproteobacteria bacterium CG11_big_fil_rev_8_21_14_0_20_39_49]|nr:MAG: hypothetical protein COV35_02680 [Alphaproteobacteria bacterium CG11_big_fil_rev_8_21_14_0_20_39_49]